MDDIVIIEKDKPGLLATISTLLAREGINILRLAALQAGGQAVIVLGVPDYKRAIQILSSNNFTVLQEKSLVVKLEDKPGALAEVAQRLKDSFVNMKAAYIIGRSGNTVYVALQVDNPQEASAALTGLIYKSETTEAV